MTNLKLILIIDLRSYCIDYNRDLFFLLSKNAQVTSIQISLVSVNMMIFIRSIGSEISPKIVSLLWNSLATSPLIFLPFCD